MWIGQRVLGAVILMLAFAWAAGCGESPSTSDSSPPPATGSGVQPTGTASGPPTGEATGGPAPPTAKRNVIAWILSLGPGTPSGPASTYFEAYAALQEQKCDVVQQKAGDVSRQIDQASGDLFAGAANACFAALRGRSDLWPQAEAVRDAVSDPAALHCMDMAVFGLLDRLVQAHRADPNAQFEIGTVSGSAMPPPCPRIAQLDPDHGVPGDQVTIVGSNLEKVTLVVLHYVPDGMDVINQSDLIPAGEGRRFSVPESEAAIAATAVCVVLIAVPGWETDSRLFTFDQAGTNTSPSPADSPSTDTPAQPPPPVARADCPAR